MGKLIEMVHGGSITYFFPVACVALFGKMLNFIFSRNVFRAMKKKDAYFEMIEKLRERGKRRKKFDADKEIVAYLGKERYPIAGFFIVFLLEAFVGLLVALVFRAGSTYLYDISLADVALIDLRMDLSLFAMARGAVSSMGLAAGFFFAVCAVGLQYFFAQKIEEGLVIDRKLNDLLSLALVAAGAIFLPSAFCVYWIAAKLLDFAQLILSMR